MKHLSRQNINNFETIRFLDQFDVFQALGPLQIASARRAEDFGSGISFWEALRLDIEEILVST